MFRKTMLFCVFLLLMGMAASCADTDVLWPDSGTVSESTAAEPEPVLQTEKPLPTAPETESETASSPAPDLAAVRANPAVPSPEETELLYKYAAELWNLLHISTLEGIFDPALAVEEHFFPVRDYPTVESLLARFRESYTEALSQSLLTEMLDNQYRERDGKLYVTPADRGTDIRVGKSVLSAETVDDETVRVLRTVTVCDVYDIGSDFLWYPIGLSPQELMLVYEDGRWVFDSFTVADDLSVYDRGEGVRYAYGKEIAASFLQAEQKARPADYAGYGGGLFGRNITAFRENGDGSVTAEVEVYIWEDNRRTVVTAEYTAYRASDGTWTFAEPFILPETYLPVPIEK